jgi:hypothetical protein
MSLSLQERVVIILMCGREGWTQRKIAADFNNIHPERNPVSQSLSCKLNDMIITYGKHKPATTRMKNKIKKF